MLLIGLLGSFVGLLFALIGQSVCLVGLVWRGVVWFGLFGWSVCLFDVVTVSKHTPNYLPGT